MQDEHYLLQTTRLKDGGEQGSCSARYFILCINPRRTISFMHKKILHHVTLMCSDLQATTAFYHRELGLEPINKGELDYPGCFLQINAEQELHLAEMKDRPPSFRGHFCLQVQDFNRLFWRMDKLGILETSTWGKIRELPNGSIQFYVRDPANNLVEITSFPEARLSIDSLIFSHSLWGGTPYKSGLGDGRKYVP